MTALFRRTEAELLAAIRAWALTLGIPYVDEVDEIVDWQLSSGRR